MIRRNTDTPLERSLRRGSPSPLDRALADLLAEGRHVLILGCQEWEAERREAGGTLPVEWIHAPDQVAAYPTRKLGIIYAASIPDEQLRRIWAEIQLLNPLAEMRFVELPDGGEPYRSSKRCLS